MCAVSTVSRFAAHRSSAQSKVSVSFHGVEHAKAFLSARDRRDTVFRRAHCRGNRTERISGYQCPRHRCRNKCRQCCVWNVSRLPASPLSPPRTSGIVRTASRSDGGNGLPSSPGIRPYQPGIRTDGARFGSSLRPQMSPQGLPRSKAGHPGMRPGGPGMHPAGYDLLRSPKSYHPRSTHPHLYQPRSSRPQIRQPRLNGARAGGRHWHR